MQENQNTNEHTDNYWNSQKEISFLKAQQPSVPATTETSPPAPAETKQETQPTTPNIESQLQTQSSKPQTDSMEVHHHPHVAKKNFKEYFLEFIMIFLAVTLGFFAENIRESQVEKETAKKYVESFYEDLKTDTSRMKNYTDFDDAKLAALNNLKNCFDTISSNITSTSCLLELMKISAFNRAFKMTDRTLNQLSNAGGFKLLRKGDADSILAYENNFDAFQDFQATVYQEAQDKVRTTFDQLVNFSANAQMFKPKDNRIDLDFDSKDVTMPLLHDNGLLNKYFNELLLYYRVTYNHRARLIELKEYQTRLINYFKDKYHYN